MAQTLSSSEKFEIDQQTLLEARVHILTQRNDHVSVFENAALLHVSVTMNGAKTLSPL